MPGATYDPERPLRVQVASRSPHTFAYKLWTARPGDAGWTPLDRGTIETPARDYGPFPPATPLAYTLLVAGNPNTDWKVQVLLSQGGEPLSCSPPAETGITNGRGAARADGALALE